MGDVEDDMGLEETDGRDDARAQSRSRTALTFLICLAVCLAAYLVGFSYEHADAIRKADLARHEQKCPLPFDGSGEW